MKQFLFLLSLAQVLLVPSPSARAATVYSVESLNILCGGNGGDDGPCRVYLQGVVETWMLKDLESFEPTRYRSRVGQPAFCETIMRVSEDEWVRVVRRALPAMKSGLASPAVQKALAASLCEG